MNYGAVQAVLRAGLLAIVSLAFTARAQDFIGPIPDGSAGSSVVPLFPSPPFIPAADPRLAEGFNPLEALGDAAALIKNGSALAPGLTGFSPAESYDPGTADPEAGPEAGAQGPGPRGSFSVALNIMVLLTAIALVPSIMLMCTCFVRILVVLALLRQAMGTQSVPPTQVITALALFMTAMVMAPTVDRVWDEAVVPWRAGEVADYGELWDRAKAPIRDFMFAQIDASNNWSSVYTMLNYRGVDTSQPELLTRADVDMTVLVPAYMISELKVSFLMGFRVYLPFLVIDVVIASILISMSMMTLPPVLISLPFKLLLFVLVDGWALIVGSLLESVAVTAPGSGVEPAALLAVPLLFRRGRRDRANAAAPAPHHTGGPRRGL